MDMVPFFCGTASLFYQQEEQQQQQQQQQSLQNVQHSTHVDANIFSLENVFLSGPLKLIPTFRGALSGRNVGMAAGLRQHGGDFNLCGVTEKP